MNTDKFQALAQTLKGELHYDKTMRILYATDASHYREMPDAVALPIDNQDIITLIAFAQKENIALIPRTAGTSLAGQVVGKGIIVDVSKYMNRILEVNPQEKWVRVQMGVIRDDLNKHLAQYGLFFAPETSTANRAMIGGMIGNNSCGSNSIVYGTTRDHLLEAKVLLADGSEAVFEALDKNKLLEKCNSNSNSLEKEIYAFFQETLSKKEIQDEIRTEFPKKEVTRRNTGYALDALLDLAPFTENGENFNLCKLLAGSEGTLAFLTEAKLNLLEIPKKPSGLVCAHFETVIDSTKATLIAMRYKPRACELMDNYILECTKTNIEQRQNRFFVQGDPGALLVIELEGENQGEIEEKARKMQTEMQAVGLGYHFPMVWGEDMKKVWNLRKAGLGLLSNLAGDARPLSVVEDTAVAVAALPEYIKEFNEILAKYGLYSVHYAHAGAGELHLRPIINAKTPEGVQLMRTVTKEVAELVKKFKGSLSGEHGDGRARAEFIPLMVGGRNYALFQEVKQVFDEKGIFNPNKIVNAPPIHENMRYKVGEKPQNYETYYDFSRTEGVVRAAELCNGSGDCRKTHLSGGTMCPSYMATKNEKDTTRARANVLREVLTYSENPNAWDSAQVKEVMDLCLSCKACKAECPSNVDVAKLKAEFTQHYYEQHGLPFRSWLFGNFAMNTRLAAMFPRIYNFLFSTHLTANLGKQIMGVAPQRSIPLLYKMTFKDWFETRRLKEIEFRTQKYKGQVYLFADEFTNYNDVEIGIKACKLLDRLGYEVVLPPHVESGRTQLSKGLVKQAKEIAERNVNFLKNIVSAETPLIGIEPSAILSFRDDYVELVPPHLRENAEKLGKNALLFEEFIAREKQKGNIGAEHFTKEKRLVKLHGHCHQKALSNMADAKRALSLPENYEVQLIPSGCCGMAGSFGYEAEHYEVSMQIGELVLFPTVRQQPENVIVVASGTSCRHQIKDGTGRHALHAVEVLWEAII